jgi:hypothetical protein
MASTVSTNISSSSSSSFTVGPVGFPTVGTAAYRLIVSPCFGSHLSPPGALRAQMARRNSGRERDNYGREMGYWIYLTIATATVIVRIIYMPQICVMGPTALLPLQRIRKIRGLRPGSNPRSWVPEASALTTRPPEPLPTDIYKWFALYFTFRYFAILSLLRMYIASVGNKLVLTYSLFANSPTISAFFVIYFLCSWYLMFYWSCIIVT